MLEPMKERISRRLAARSWWCLVTLSSCYAMSSCLSDVAIPDCLEHTCEPDGGVPGDGAPPGIGAAGGLGATAGGQDGDGSTGVDQGIVDVGGAAAVEASGVGGDAAGAGGAAGTRTLVGECPSCVVLPAELTAPCAGKGYRATLNASGGVAPYQWRLSPPVDGWSVTADPGHPERALLQAAAAAPGQTDLTITVRDSRGLEKLVRYATTAREACLFAYTGKSGGEEQLQLVDPFAQPTSPATLENNSGVYDFRFSPNGQYLVYRYGFDGQHPRGRHLALVELSTLDEQKLDFAEDAVTAYSWSPDSLVLAVGFVAAGQRYLGGVRLAVRASDSPTALVPLSSEVNDNLTWVGQDFVAYHAELNPDPQSLDHFQTPAYAKLRDAGFVDERIAIDSFEGGVSLQPAQDGFWIINDMLPTFFPIGDLGSDSVLHAGVSLISPSGRYSAALDGQDLRFFAADEGTYTFPAAASGPEEMCPMPLSWSTRDTVACVADVANGKGGGHHGDVRFFDLESGSEVLKMTTLGGSCGDDVALTGAASCTFRREGYGFDVQAATAAPRGFSPSGRWFAFTRAVQSDAYLYWSDLSVRPPALTNAFFMGGRGRISRFSLSADDRKIAFQVGERLFVKDLNGVRPETEILIDLAPAAPCGEDFPSAPDQYCGNSEPAAQFKWSPDSAALAFRAPGSVTVVDTTHSQGLDSFPQSAPLCEEPLCSGDFDFQPPRNQ